MINKKKHAYFLKIAHTRLSRILEDLHALGNCSNPAVYSYDVKELAPLFKSIYEKTEEVRQRLTMHSPYGGIPFRLGAPKVVELSGQTCQRQKFVPLTDVLNLLEDGQADFVSLAPVRERYETLFGSDLCWSFPVSADDHIGCTLLPVREGILYLPYDDMDHDRYERFSPKGTSLLTCGMAAILQGRLRTLYADRTGILSDILSFRLASDGNPHEEVPQ